MARWWWLLGGGLVAAGAAWVLIEVARFGQVARDDASTYGAFAIAVLGLVIPAAKVLLGKAKSSARPNLDRLTDRFAVVIGDQWERAARDRRLIDPPPLPIRWSRSSAPVTGRITDATRRGPNSLDPLPGIDPVSTAQLRRGTHRMLHKIYGGLASGRLILVGGPGSGKSAAAILLLLEALRYRRQRNPAERARIPVPVLFTLQGWNPRTTSLQEWIIRKLVSEIPLLAHRTNRRHVGELLRPERIALFLDGLDEIPQQLRVPALNAVSAQANFRIVLLTRTIELVEAAQHHTLTNAVALELQPVSHADAADYLMRRLTEPAPRPWRDLVTELTDQPDGTLALTLNNPLTITLLRDIYPSTRLPDSPVGDVDELLDIARFPDPETITNHLLDHAVTVAYTPQPGQPKPRYTPKEARRTLAFIAEHLRDEKTRDLAWWTIPDWMPRFSLTPTSGVLGLIWGAVIGLAIWIVTGFPGLGLMVCGAGLVTGVLVVRMNGSNSTSDIRMLWRQVMSWENLVPAIRRGGWVPCIVSGLLAGLIGGLKAGLIAGVGALISCGVVLLVMVMTTRDLRKLSSPQGVRRFDLAVVTLLGLVLGLFMGVALALAFGLPAAVVALGPPVGVLMALPLSASWTAWISQAYFWAKYGVSLPLLHFLEDARARHLLRTVGGIYQFRHATLQDRLAPPAR